MNNIRIAVFWTLELFSSKLPVVHLLGPRDDLPRLTAAFDLATSSSAFGEALPLVLGEAMACGVPCVATDVGDSAFLIGDTGRSVPPRDPARLAAAWAEMLALPLGERVRLGAAARQRIAEEFSLEAMTQRYQQLWTDIARPATADGD